MTVKELEQRVVALEHEVQRLRKELQATKPNGNRDWLGAIEKFAGDEHLLAVFAEARKLREKDRQQARRGKPSERKPRS